ncbi:hypothetical protein [Parvibaculum sp.]|uniref:hypothetical protein n=1 Tax=Parvibaculum sp. TaxID=2024848 RepID=UPI002FDAEBD1
MLAALLGFVPAVFEAGFGATFFSGAFFFAAGLAGAALAFGFAAAAFVFAGFAGALAFFAAGFAAALVFGADFVALVLAVAAFARVVFAAGFTVLAFDFEDFDAAGLDLGVFVVLLAIVFPVPSLSKFQRPKEGSMPSSPASHCTPATASWPVHRRTVEQPRRSRYRLRCSVIDQKTGL